MSMMQLAINRPPWVNAQWWSHGIDLLFQWSLFSLIVYCGWSCQGAILWQMYIVDPTRSLFYKKYIDGLVQDCSNSIANALELLQSCTKPWYHGWLHQSPSWFGLCSSVDVATDPSVAPMAAVRLGHKISVNCQLTSTWKKMATAHRL